MERLFAIGPPEMFAGDPVSPASLLAILFPSAQNPIRSLLDAGAAGIDLSVSIVLEIDTMIPLKDLVRQRLAPASSRSARSDMSS
ncbi:MULTISPECIES: hypothetical protein [Bradyrhizobium]|uniref:Uncharacterized protein n=2 Tax=Bradyrhizobium TaxID=374 RepID=A0A9X1RAS7_9BRAD|nr:MULTISPECIES: hypothetical protein [Bradyrhizobium]MCG2628175.1 hypothetical protein [Bradyrhizobium zhengyangense]MCG2643294.1 hypothetical protein [Bradyrhizobium zhengyangense]MCG2670392.1 hypothetical protein [Bradyrhizobium zhengyangense]MDN4985873.1 hypothetical protein [Bradyrhizobium sp. WYCCWR 13022]MDN5002748.1 hypothetical protein [Bradyrhizobium sp. WYCCWR 12677]